jgi:DNA-binding SARP family transcriptional activator
MRFGLLGPLLMLDNDTPCAPSAPKQRQLLSFLLVHANQFVSFADCIEELWESELPSSVIPTLRTYVMHLRRVLRTVRGPERLVTRGQGYVFHTEPGELDLELFETGVATARRAVANGDDETAARLLTDALALWRGNALTGIVAGPVLRTRLAEFEEHRRSATVQRIEIDLRLGRHHELLGELATLVATYPLHEEFRAAFMTALYRSGRPIPALRVYHELRQLLADQYGLEPSPRIQRLQQGILIASSDLDVPAQPTSWLTLDLFAERVLQPS